jgi:hypothetical protein
VVLLGVHEDVDEGVADLLRRLERTRVVAVAPEAPFPAQGPVHPARGADAEAADTGGELPRIRGLDDEVQVIALHREVQHPEVRA